MNICFLLGGFTGVGGIGRVTSILSNALCEDEQYTIKTLSFHNNGKKNLYVLDERIAQSFLFDRPINMTKGVLSGGIAKLRKYLLLNQIDILVACGALYYPIAIFSCKGIRTKCICWEHSNVHNKKDHSFQALSRWVGAKSADLVVTLTQYDQKEYIKKYSIDNVNQIYNPIDNKIFDCPRQYDLFSKRILSVGRLSYQKNFMLLIDIAKEILNMHKDWSWDIYGEGEEKEELQAKIIENGLSGRLELKGKADNMYNIYNNYAMLVMTSRYEGFPMVLLEATACSLPLISFDVLTGPNEIIENEVNGYLVEPFNIEQMIYSIDSLIKNQKNRIMFSKNASDTSSNFKLDRIKIEWEKSFNEVLYE